MSVTILEALRNANYNIQIDRKWALNITKAQLNNAVTLLNKGYSIDDEVEPLIEKYGDIDNVPNKE